MKANKFYEVLQTGRFAIGDGGAVRGLFHCWATHIALMLTVSTRGAMP